MKKIFRNNLFIFSIALIILIFLYSLFRSLLDKTLFFVSLDFALSKLISSLWNFLSNPVIFIALLICFILFSSKTNLVNILASLREISAGGVSAKFEYSQSAISEKPDLKSNTKREQKPSFDPNAYGLLLTQGLGKKTCDLYLFFDDKIAGPNDWLDQMKKSDFLSRYPEKYTNRDFYMGYYRALESYQFRYLLDMKYSDDKNTAHIKLKPGVRQAIEKQLEKLSLAKPK